MALAKYAEDIADRYSDDNWERINALFATRDFEKEWTERIGVESAAVAAKIQGLFFEDRMVFLRSKEIQFSIVCASNRRAVVAIYAPKVSAPVVIFPNGEGLYTFPQPNVDGRLELQCGFYTKSYTVTFLDKPKPEAFPDVQRALTAIVKNPAQWTSTGFEQVRSQLEACLALPAIPAEFALGVKEFYLGLFHESLGEQNFRKRLETAFNVLRPFCAYSDYATLICAYFYFRVNCFDRVATLKEIPGLAEVATFYTKQFQQIRCNKPEKKKSESKSVESVQILVSNRDYFIFRAVESYLAADYNTCERNLTTAADSAAAGLDPQGEERLSLVRARLARQTGNAADARLAYGKLRNSATSLFRAEATEFLDSFCAQL